MAMGRGKITVRPAVRADMLAFIKKDPPRTCRAWVAEKNGELMGIAGYYMDPPLVFSQITDELRKHPVFIARVAKMFMAMVPAPIFAIASEDECSSERFLSWLGFKWVKTEQGDEVYLWQTH